jgi:hypothetical protein
MFIQVSGFQEGDPEAIWVNIQQAGTIAWIPTSSEFVITTTQRTVAVTEAEGIRNVRGFLSRPQRPRGRI